MAYQIFRYKLTNGEKKKAGQSEPPSTDNNDNPVALNLRATDTNKGENKNDR